MENQKTPYAGAENKKFDADEPSFIVYNRKEATSVPHLWQNGGGDYEVSNCWKYYAGSTGAF